MADRFDKFTERARRVLSLAQEEAQRFNHNYIGTEHFLLGLVREGDGIAARVLNNLGVQLPKVRFAVESRIGRGETMVMGEIGLTPRAKRVIELAVDEARRLNHHYIGTEHLLLGLVREGEGIAAQVLRDLGVELDKVRAQVIQVLSQGGGGYFAPAGSLAIDPDTPPELAEALRELEALRHEMDAALAASDFDRVTALREIERPLKARISDLERAWQRQRPQQPWQGAGPASARVPQLNADSQRVMALAQEEAQRFNHTYIGTEHILLGLIRLESSVAGRVFARLGVELSRVRSAVEFIIGRGTATSPGPSGLTPRGVKVIDLARDEARRLNQHAVAPEHLLLGLIREGEGIAAGVLESLGVHLDKARAQVIQQLMQSPGPRPITTILPPGPPLSSPAREPLGEIVDVLPVAGRIEQGETAITLLALERYDNGFVATFRQLAPGPHRMLHEFLVTGEDDGGRRYEAIMQGGYGGSSPERFEWRFSYRFAPALDSSARALTVTFAVGGAAAEEAPGPWTFAIQLPGKDLPTS